MKFKPAINLKAWGLICIGCLLFTGGVAAFADDAPVVPTQSGTIVPYHEEFIRLVSEEIDIHLGRWDYRVEVDYVFENTGSAMNITMGFPNQSDWMYGTSIEDFRAWVDGEEQEIYQKQYRASPKPHGPGTAPDYYYECFDTSFRGGQTRRVKNTYSQEYVSDYDRSFQQATYILSTGAYWRDTIETVEVRIHHGRRSADLEPRSAFFMPDQLPDRPTQYEGLEITPEPTGSFENGTIIVLNDVEPDFDIEITMPPPVVEQVTATSELQSSRYSYAPENVLDMDPGTSWVEGEEGPGIDTSLGLLLSARSAGGKLEGSYEIAAIGMINGYAARESLYYANNRVKLVEVETMSFVDGERSIFTWKLAETMDMQFYEFDEPVLAGHVTVTLKDVYPGNSWDDTCIAELVVVPAPPRRSQVREMK